MSDERKEPWLNWLALTTVILAVCATLSTFKGGSYSTRSVLSQTKAANQWAYYQAKSIKGYLYEIQKEELELARQSDPGRQPAAVRAQVEKRLAGYREKLARYEREKAEIQAEAKRFEAVRDDATVHAQTFGMAVDLPAGRDPALVRGRAAPGEASAELPGLLSGSIGLWYFANGSASWHRPLTADGRGRARLRSSSGAGRTRPGTPP